MRRLGELIAATAPTGGPRSTSSSLPTVRAGSTHDRRWPPTRIGVNARLGRNTHLRQPDGPVRDRRPAPAWPGGRDRLGPAAGSRPPCRGRPGRIAGEPFEPAPPRRAARVRLAVVGAHLRGQPLNHQLVDRGAELVATTRDGARYRLYASAGRAVRRGPASSASPGGGASRSRSRCGRAHAAAFGRVRGRGARPARDRLGRARPTATMGQGLHLRAARPRRTPRRSPSSGGGAAIGRRRSPREPVAVAREDGIGPVP